MMQLIIILMTFRYLQSLFCLHGLPNFTFSLLEARWYLLSMVNHFCPYKILIKYSFSSLHFPFRQKSHVLLHVSKHKMTAFLSDLLFSACHSDAMGISDGQNFIPNDFASASAVPFSYYIITLMWRLEEFLLASYSYVPFITFWSIVLLNYSHWTEFFWERH